MSALGLGTAHILFSNPLFAAVPGRFPSSNPVQLTKLGKSGIETTLIGIGTGVHAGNRTSFLTKQDKQKAWRLSNTPTTKESAILIVPILMGLMELLLKPWRQRTGRVIL